ncbi:uncharacterized protein KY384_005904 [Bacidia gigantensis]|uniref:uncharacterized protein n=1 Tax=Bacidia gigantensis TaxID=2732470 RepID=UPI001D056D14|nr:uncharacterized protein KY384_005904 [Bacidia gigantensis]KAG8529269.1 hypothetical protein KY384_005904 [Bacidia gigantensis]
MPSPPPDVIAYQRNHASDFNAGGLEAFIIAGVCIITILVGLRLWSRKMQKIAWKSDDFTLIGALLITIGDMVCKILFFKFGFGRHFYSLPFEERVQYKKCGYSSNILYTTSYPLSRISLVLLYHRIFVQKWFRTVCWMFVAIFFGYALSTAIADVFLTVPVNARWNSRVKPVRTVDQIKLFVANAAFNITTDILLLLLPTVTIWRMRMTTMHKIGLTAIFSLGVLTIIASFFRLKYFYKVDGNDPTCEGVESWPFPTKDLSPTTTQTKSESRSMSETNGKEVNEAHAKHQPTYELLPIPTTPQPLHYPATPSHLEDGKAAIFTNPITATAAGHAAGTTLPGDIPYVGIARNAHGMALDQEAALASLDPRYESQNLNSHRAEVTHEPTAGDGEWGGKGLMHDEVPQGMIAVKRDWKLEEKRT